MNEKSLRSSPAADVPLLLSCKPCSDGSGEAISTARRTQAIAHRGFRVQFPENSLVAFEGAVKAGAHAIEADLHLSRDGVVVISHDATLKRCFGVDKKIIDCDVAYIKTLRTLRKPHVPMPTLKEVVEFLCEPAAQKTWLLLDIKLDDDAADMMRLTAEAINSVHPGAEHWKGRIVLGCWRVKHVPLCQKYLPGFHIVHIGTALPYAREFLKFPGVGFNIFWSLLQTSAGKKFVKEAKDSDRAVYVWTINDEDTMKWAIKSDFIDGVCTDNPIKFLQLCNGYAKTWTQAPLSSLVTIVVWRVMASFLSALYRWRYGK